jgi:hypothetical protein
MAASAIRRRASSMSEMGIKLTEIADYTERADSREKFVDFRVARE